MKDLFYGILELASQKKYSDIHLNTGYLPTVRNNSGQIEELTEVEVNGVIQKTSMLSLDDMKEIIELVIEKKGLEKFLIEHEVDGSYKYLEKERYRINCYVDSHGYSMAMRTIPKKIPTMEELGLWEQLKSLCKRSKWLILMTGPTGTGKSTNIAAMIDHINKTQSKHIITIEDPIEFEFENDKCLINQRQIGVHTESFASAIRASLREDPDIIVIGEMRDPETIRAAITLAETGHLVLSTLHTNDTVQTIDRIVDVFPSDQQNQVRMQFAMNLLGVVSQRLLPRSDTDGRIAAREILLNNDATRNLIISGKTNQLYSVLEIGQKSGMILMDKYLAALYKKGLINRETLVSFTRDKDNLDILGN